MKINFTGLSLFLVSCVLASQVQAGIVLGSTRIVFEAQNKEENITVRNEGANPILLQSWLDAGKDDESAVPFAVTPPLTKMTAGGRQLLRILYKGSGLPQDRESVVWLNVQEIPQAVEGKSTLQIAVRQRIKVFYRPANLLGDARDAAGALQWTLDSGGKSISVSNPTSYYVSTIQMKLEQGGKVTMVKERYMLAPGARTTFPLEQPVSASDVRLNFRSINDWGGQETYNAPLVSSGSAQALRVTDK